MKKKSAADVAQELADKHGIALPGDKKDAKQAGPEPAAVTSPAPKTEIKAEDHRNPAAEKRIHELVDEIKQLRESVDTKDREYQGKLSVLEKEKDEIQRKMKEPIEVSIDEQLVSMEQGRVMKYLQEDKSKPRQLRRELDKAELEEWLAEDLVEASEWIADRKLRRREEKQRDVEDLHLKKKANDTIYAQELSNVRVLARHPELDISKRIKELKTQGMSKDDVMDTISKENEKVRIMRQIQIENPELLEKAMLSPNGPEIVEQELMKRLRNPVKTTVHNPDENILAMQKRIADLEDMLSAEGMRRGNIDVSTGIRRSTGSIIPTVDVSRPKTAEDLELEKALTKVGMTKAEYDEQVLRRSKIPGITYRE